MSDSTLLHPPIPDGYKRCTICKQLKPATYEYFCKRSSRPDGLNYECKSCAQLRVAQWRRNNPERKRQSNREYREANVDSIRQYKQEWRERNREYVRAFDKERYQQKREVIKARIRSWYQRNKTEVRKYHRERYQKLKPEIRVQAQKWKVANPDRVRISGERRRARERNLPRQFTFMDWQRALEYFDYRCAICRRSADFWTLLVADHWIPLSSPICPGTVPQNMIPLCHARPDSPAGQPCCNNSKSNKSPEAWLIEKYGELEAAEILGRIQQYFEVVKCPSRSR